MGVVLTYAGRGANGATEHEVAACVAVAKALAALKRYEFAGGYDPGMRRNGPVYYVPSATLQAAEADELGIRDQNDLFGGVVPHPFVANKTIAHPLAGADARRPSGWVDAFARSVRDVVLPGMAAFSREDARRGAQALLAEGPVRIKPGHGIAGKGQVVVETLAELDAALDRLDAAALEREGMVVERHLEEITTFSVGQVCVDALRASYCGTQKLTRNNHGRTVYGGSDLLVARGGYAELLQLELPEVARIAIAQAQRFDEASAQFDGLFASRRNYDVLRGRDRAGNWHCGVLEQSWRIGGASGPEVAALGAFRADARLRAVHAHSTEVFGEDARPPRGAIVHYHGTDSAAGPLLKYTVVESYARAQ